MNPLKIKRKLTIRGFYFASQVESRRSVAAAKRNGLTLLELMVVLAIMAALATVAVQSMQPRINQSRYEATQQTLENIHTAILGDPNARQFDGTPLISGFVADTGRLPDSMAELLFQGSFPNAAAQSAEHHPEITLTHGWRGPYLKLAPSAIAVHDGWGRDLEFTRTDSMVRIKSFGSDGMDDTIQPPADLYMQDQQIVRHLVTISGNVVDANGDPVPSATVKLFLPQHGEDHLLEISDSEGDANATFQFNDVPPGTRVIRAEAEIGASPETTTLAGVHYLHVPPTGLMNVVITVR